MVDSNLLVWIMRLQQTEALVEKRKADLQGHEQRAVNLQADLMYEHNLSDTAVQELATLHEQSQALTCIAVQLQQDTSAARQDLASAQDTARLLAQKKALQQQVERLRAAADNERSVQQQYEASVARHMEDRGRRTQELKDRAQQIKTRLQRLEEQEAKLCLPDITNNLQRQQKQLQNKLQQLTATLTDSKQANACMRARVDATTADTKTQLQAATERLADVKREAFQLKRQAAVNETRLQQLRQESSRNKQQCGELEELIGRASAVMDQLASNCDL